MISYISVITYLQFYVIWNRFAFLLDFFFKKTGLKEPAGNFKVRMTVLENCTFQWIVLLRWILAQEQLYYPPILNLTLVGWSLFSLCFSVEIVLPPPSPPPPGRHVQLLATLCWAVNCAAVERSTKGYGSAFLFSRIHVAVYRCVFPPLPPQKRTLTNIGSILERKVLGMNTAKLSRISRIRTFWRVSDFFFFLKQLWCLFVF